VVSKRWNEQGMQKILAVDDSPIMQEMIRRALTDHFVVLAADNAVDALQVLSHEEIGLMLLDVSMPDIDGLELCRTLRSMSQFRELPVIMLTARDRAFDKMQGRMAGATEYLTKPFEASQLHEVVAKYLPSKV